MDDGKGGRPIRTAACNNRKGAERITLDLEWDEFDTLWGPSTTQVTMGG